MERTWSNLWATSKIGRRVWIIILDRKGGKSNPLRFFFVKWKECEEGISGYFEEFLEALYQINVAGAQKDIYALMCFLS